MGHDLPSRLMQFRFYALFFALAAFGIILVTYGLYHFESDRLKARQYQALRGMGDLKEHELTLWLKERRADATRVALNIFLVDYGARLLQNPGDVRTATLMREWLHIQRMGNIYVDVLLVDPAGKTILAARDDSHELNPVTRRIIPQVLKENRALQGDFYRNSRDNNTIFSDTLVPVRDRTGRLLFLVVLKSDAGVFLFPLLKKWHVFTQSGETLLVQKEGEDVVFINDLRHQADTSLRLRFPLTKLDLPAAQAVLGRTGMFFGRDYRGKPVMTDLRPIAGTPWFIVAKVDEEEILQDLSQHLKVFTLLAALLILLAGMALAYYYRRKQARLYHASWQAERARQESEERFKATVYSIGDGVIVTDEKGIVRQMNPVAAELTGWKEAEAAGLPLNQVFNIINEETRAIVDNPVDQVFREGFIVGLANHTLLIARDKTERPIADSAAPIKDQEGAIMGVVLVFRDQTEERAHHRQIEESQRKMATLLANLPGMAYRCRLDENWTAEFMSEGCLALTGWRPEEFIDNRVVSLEVITHPDDRDYVRHEVDAALLADGPYTLEYRVCTREGEERWVWERGRLVAAMDGAEPRFEGFIMDITERKKAEEALHETQFRLAQTVDFLPDATFVIDRKGKVLNWNRAMEELTGVAAGDIVGKGDYAYALPFYGKRRPIMIDLVLQADEEIVAAYASFHQEPGRIVSETRLPDFRGRGETWLWNTASVLNDDEGEVIGAIQSIRDITVQKKREQDLETALTLQRQAEEAGRLMAAQFHQAQKMEAIGRLAGGIAHDFNNMLNVILGQAQLVALKLGKETPAAANIEEITKAAQRSAELIRQLLGYARKQIINPQIVDVNEAAENLLKMLRRLIGEDIDLVWKPYGHLWPVKIDPSQFNQLLTNLTVNARDAISGQGLITIETDNVQFDARYCETHLGFAVGDYVLLAVSDNGCGMNKEVMDRLFEPFFTTKPKGVGTGLGLATVYGVVKQNGGFINVYSEPGRGSTFKIYLPRDQESPASRPCPPSLPCLPTGKETILLVEDEESLLEIGEEMLRHLGYRVLPASGPRRALAMLQDSPEDIHLVITDVVMPEMNGKELVDRISALRPGLKFLYMSGYTANAIVHRGILDEGLNFIQKPFSLEEMASKVRAVLDGPVKIPS